MEDEIQKPTEAHKNNVQKIKKDLEEKIQEYTIGKCTIYSKGIMENIDTKN
jgi:hypothetical protein